MTKHYSLRLQLAFLSAFCIGFMSVANAQAPTPTPTESQPSSNQPSTLNVEEVQEKPPEQTLLQEDAPAAKTDSAAANLEDSAPSLSEYLNQKTGNSAPAAQAATTGTNGVETIGIPGLDSGALAATEQETPEQIRAKDDLAIRKEAFKAATGQMMPLNPSEIRRLLELYDETRQAAETPIYPSPEPESSFQTISLDPGAKPLLIKTAMGNVTTVSLVDITGQPWPIQDMTWAGDFQIEQPEQGSHILRITPTSEFAKGNMSMRVVGLNPPVIFSLSAERKSVHVRLDVQIPEMGPKGVLPPIEGAVTTKAGDEGMSSLLMGITGKDVSKMTVEGIDGRTTAFSKGGLVYIRTPYTMLSPAWVQSVQSGDGMKVYALNFTPVILLSDKGKMVRAYLSHKENTDEQ